jgi:CubicO group peptidase (beta-lactamase class C family)
MSALGTIGRWRTDWQVPNAVAAVFTADGVVESSGELDQVFRLASVTKLLTAYAVLVGLEEEALGLDDPAGPPGGTVRHLLAHTAGYGFESDSPVMASPGAKRIYSNRGFEELGRHFSEVTDIEFAQYLHEGVLEPLGLAATELRGSPAYAAWSTAHDLIGFGQELLAPKLLAESTLQNAVAVHFPGLPGILPGLGRFSPLDWGLGFERNFGKRGHWAGSLISTSAFGHFGAAGTFLWIDPEAGVGCVCLTDRDFGDWAKQAWPALCDAILSERLASLNTAQP